MGVLLRHHNAGPLFHLITSQTDAQCCFDWTDTTAGSLFPAALKPSWLFWGSAQPFTQILTCHVDWKAHTHKRSQDTLKWWTMKTRATSFFSVKFSRVNQLYCGAGHSIQGYQPDFSVIPFRSLPNSSAWCHIFLQPLSYHVHITDN